MLVDSLCTLFGGKPKVYPTFSCGKLKKKNSKATQIALLHPTVDISHNSETQVYDRGFLEIALSFSIPSLLSCSVLMGSY